MLSAALLFAVCTFLLWGTTNFFIGYGEKNRDIDPVHFAAVMWITMGVMGVLLIVYLLLTDNPISVDWRLAFPIAAGIFLGVGILTFAFAMSDGDMSTGATAAIATSNAVFTTMLAFVILRENLSLQEWIGIGTVVLGIVILRV